MNSTPQYETELKKINRLDEPSDFQTTSQPKFLTTTPVRQRRSRLAGYSRYVIFMKFVLPSVALAIVATIMIWPQVQVIDKRFSIGLSNVKLSARENLNMVNARFVGADKKKQPFSITADIARNLLPGETQIELEMPKADITVGDGAWLVLTANTGVYNQKEKLLNLEGGVNLFHDSGYEFKTKSTDIDLNKGIALSNSPVKGQGPFGQLEAEGLRINEKVDRIYFTGKSKLTFFPNALKGEK